MDWPFRTTKHSLSSPRKTSSSKTMPASDLLELQNVTSERIQRIIRSYKKNSGDRKSKASYYKERYRNFPHERDAFGNTDGILVYDQSYIEYFESILSANTGVKTRILCHI